MGRTPPRPSPLTQRPEPAQAAEPAETMAPPRRRRDRYDRPRFTYRIDPSIHDELHRIQDELQATGDFQTSIDQIAEDIFLAGIAAYDAGTVEISGQDLRPTARAKRP